MHNFSLTEFKDAWVQKSIPSLLDGSSIFLLSAGNTIAKIAGSALSLFSTGKSKINRFANKGFSSIFDAQLLLPSLFFITIRFFNPYSKGMEFIENFESRGKFVGLLTQTIAYPILKKGVEEADNQANPNLRKHIASRCCFLFGTTLLAVTKTIELAYGLFLTAFATATVGNSPGLNDHAMKYLSALDGVEELCAGIRLTINPWTNIGSLGTTWSGSENWEFRKTMWRLA